MLFYRSTYYHSLHAAKQFITNHHLNLSEDFEFQVYKKHKYIPFTRCIVSPDVGIYGKLLADGSIEHTSDMFPIIPMMAAAAPCFVGNNMKRMKQLPNEDMIFPQPVIDALTRMWKTIFFTAICRGTKNLFIGPIVCGAYAPNPFGDNFRIAYKRLVATIMTEHISDYGSHFEYIFFTDYDTGKYAKIPQYENFDIFKKVYNDMIDQIEPSPDPSLQIPDSSKQVPESSKQVSDSSSQVNNNMITLQLIYGLLLVSSILGISLG
jgi:hypothetical protein